MTAREAATVADVVLRETQAGQEVVLGGRLDVHSVADLRILLNEVLEHGEGDLLVHLADAEVGDATGLGLIVGTHHRARRLGRRLVLVDVSPRLDRLLRSARLHRVIARAEAGAGATVVPLTA